MGFYKFQGRTSLHHLQTETESNLDLGPPLLMLSYTSWSDIPGEHNSQGGKIL